MVIEMLTALGKRINEHIKNVNKGMEYIRQYQTQVKTEEYNNWTKKYMRRVQVQIWWSRTVWWCGKQGHVLTQTEQQKENRTLNGKDGLREQWDIKHTDIYIIGLTEGGEKREQKTYLKE